MSNLEDTLSYAEFLDVFSLTKTATAVHLGEHAIIHSANEAMLRIWGKDKSIIGKSLEDALPELKGQPFINLFKKVWLDGLTISGIDTPADILVDGELRTFYFDFEYRAVKNAVGKTICILHSAVDVTDRYLKTTMLQTVKEKEAAYQREQALNEELAASVEELGSVNEELKQSQESLHAINGELENRVNERTKSLSESEARFRAMVEQSPVPMLVTTGPTMVFEIINQPMLDLIGKDESVIGKPWDEAMPELKGQDIIDQLLDTFVTGKEWSGEEIPIVIYKKEGPVLGFYNISYRPLIQNGQTVAMLQSAIDVSELVRARLMVEQATEEQQSLNEELAASNEELAAINEELSSSNEELLRTQESLQELVVDLAESDNRFRSLVEQAPVAITMLKSEDLLIEIVNDQMLEIWGKTKDIRGKKLADAVPELQGQPFLQPLKDVIVTGEPYYGYESKAFIIRRGERAEGYFNFICHPIKNENGNIDRVLQVVTEITDQVNAKLKIQNAEEMTRVAVEAAKLGSWYIEPITKVLNYNETLARIFGYEGHTRMTYDQAIGQVTEEYRDKILEEIEKAISTGEDYDFIYSQRRFNDGEIVWLRSSGKISQNDDGGFRLFSGVVMDITEQKKDELRKNDFIGMASHELKTPLTSLNGYLQMLQLKTRKTEDTFTIGALEQSIKQVKRMTTMINGFLNVSRLESGKIYIDKQSFDMAELVKEAEEEIVTLYSSHKFVFHPVEVTMVYADKDKIGQVISNFISNAVKYSGNGTTIQISCITIAGFAQVCVKDEGMGINETDLKHLFERYYRVESNTTKLIAGFGIGLYLCAEIIERHNGRIWAESEPGKGSAFYFTLPLQ